MGQETGRVARNSRAGGQGRRYTEKQTSEGKRHTRKDKQTGQTAVWWDC